MLVSRIQSGANAQDSFSEILKNYNIAVESVSTKHSNAPDIVFRLDNELKQAEVKNTERANLVIIFEKTVSRKNSTSYRPIPDVDKIIKKFKGFNTFEEYIDHLREKVGKDRAGFVGDEGIVGNSGKMMKEDFSFDSTQDKKVFLDMIRNYWKENGDDFFVVLQGSGQNFAVFSTTPEKKRILGMDVLPFSARHIREVFLATPGTTTNGKIRVALKMTLNLSAMKMRPTSRYLNTN